MNVELRRITTRNYRECLDLRVNEDQSSFVAPNSVSLAEAGIYRYEALPFAVYADDQMVGFVMLFYYPKKPEYGIWRLMIDSRFQGKGFGRLALQASVDYLVEEFMAEEIYLSVEPENETASQLYTDFGFVATGEIEDGEAIMRLVLADSVKKGN